MDSVDHLRQSVELLHDCRATHEAAVLVTETFQGQTAWEGTVHVFALEGDPTAKLAYAWSSPIEGSTKRRLFAVLQIPPVQSALDAVRAAIVGEHRERRTHGQA